MREYNVGDAVSFWYEDLNYPGDADSPRRLGFGFIASTSGLRDNYEVAPKSSSDKKVFARRDQLKPAWYTHYGFCARVY